MIRCGNDTIYQYGSITLVESMDCYLERDNLGGPVSKFQSCCPTRFSLRTLIIDTNVSVSLTNILPNNPLPYSVVHRLLGADSPIVHLKWASDSTFDIGTVS